MIEYKIISLENIKYIYIYVYVNISQLKAVVRENTQPIISKIFFCNLIAYLRLLQYVVRY